MKFYTCTLNSKEWPIQVAYAESWLDANTYWRRDQLINWLRDQNIEFKQVQDHKVFIFRFKNQEDKTLFVMRWS